jgi:hypothetical protein
LAGIADREWQAASWPSDAQTGNWAGVAVVTLSFLTDSIFPEAKKANPDASLPHEKRVSA